ncbi:MAG: methyltransferase [Clostridia bacterium]|nr:methyltransferase [Clostridia bacterium]
MLERENLAMKINLDYYKGEDLYCDGDTEKEILEYEKKYNEDNFNEIFKQDIRWPIFYHLTSLRKNILNWYPFKEKAEVLEIGAGMGAITSTLCERASKVTSVELSKQRATSIANRCKDKENLEIIVGNFNDIKFDKQYDYITLIGVLEYAPLYTGTKNSFNDFLDKIKKLLKKDGKLLIAIENQFGMKYYAGAKEDHTGIEYDGIIGYENKEGIRTFGKEELKEILKNSGLKYTKFYYPLPDYKLPNKIFAEDYLPDEKSIEDYTPYYNGDVELNFDEKVAYKEVIKNNMFEFFANSFFVECSEEPIETKVDLKNIKLNAISKEEEQFYKTQNSTQNKDEQLAILKEKLEEKENIINTIVNSRSWKLTNIFRKINKKIKK